MKRPPHSSIRVSLEMGMIAFFILAALSLLVVYVASPSIYAQSLSLTSSPADRYPGRRSRADYPAHPWGRAKFSLALLAHAGSLCQLCPPDPHHPFADC